jgi:transcriptional regulator with XRE-family HTH domain
MLVNKKEIAQRIQQIMRDIGVTQQELADLLGISQPAISLYLKGRMPPPDVLLQIARLGGTTMEWLLTGETEHEENPLSVTEKRPVYGNRITLLILWKQLPENIQRDLLTLMRHMAEIQKTEN